MYNIIQFLYQATIVLTALRCTYLAHLDLSFSPYTFPLQCRKRHSSVKFPSLSCYMAFCSPFSPILPSLFNVVKDISFYRKSWWFWLINFSFTMYLVTFHFEAKIHQNSSLIFCCCNLSSFLKANSYNNILHPIKDAVILIIVNHSFHFLFVPTYLLQCYFKFGPSTVLILFVFMIYYFHFPNLPLPVILSLLKRKPCVATILNFQALNLKSICNIE